MSFLSAALAIGLGAVRMAPAKRGFYPASGRGLVAQATVEEVHNDKLEITDHPIEQGAAITDHAFKRPAELVVNCVFSNSPSASGGLLGQAVGGAAALGGRGLRTAIGAVTTAQSLLGGQASSQVIQIYADFLTGQANKVLFDVFTGKRAYKNMLIESLNTTTDKKSENALVITVTFRQVLIVATRSVTLPLNTSALRLPQRTLPAIDLGQRQRQAPLPVNVPFLGKI
jgi:hypothetical protein